MHSPWVSQPPSQLRHETIVAHARGVRPIRESRCLSDPGAVRARAGNIDADLCGQGLTNRKPERMRGRHPKVFRPEMGKSVDPQLQSRWHRC